MTLRSRLRDAERIYAEEGGAALLGRAVTSGASRLWPLSRLYWRVHPRYYRWRRRFDVDRFDAPIDPFRVVRIDPSRISLVTGREFPPWDSFLADAGAVRGGDWDRPQEATELDLADHVSTVDAELWHAPRFEETLLHRAMVARFEEGVAWEETEFYEAIADLVRNEPEHRLRWGEEKSVEALRKRAKQVDELVANIEENGYVGGVKAAKRDGGKFPYALREEVLVDVGRDGEPRFVDGRHRLSAAKILDIEEIPVVVLVRHKEWMQERDRRWRDGDADHFDVRALG